MIHIHDLAGCAPAPLAHYLKALGVLRLVAEQADPQARGWWDGATFRLASTLSADELHRFFLFDYRPTPLVAPWNKGSGFFQRNDPGLTPMERSAALRFSDVRAGIAAARTAVDALAEADATVRTVKSRGKPKGSTKADREQLRSSETYKKDLAEAERRFRDLKAELIPNVRAFWRGPHRDWMDAALVLDEARGARYPALLGTGGNDGRLDFTNNFMQRLADLFDLADQDGGPRAPASAWLGAALWGRPAPGYLPDRAVGQFLPGGAGGANSANGPDGSSMLNPFDFVLMLEGCLVCTASTVRRLDARGGSRAAAPFATTSHAAGYASSGDTDESARGEQWMPLWGQPTTYGECRRLFAEGRAQIGHTRAAQPLDMARAVARLGVARGVDAFQRYAYIERNGQSNLAVPLGRFKVRQAAIGEIVCLDDITAWAARVKRQASDADAAAALRQATRRLGGTYLEAAQRPEHPLTWQTLLLGMAEIEAVMRRGAGFKAQPAPALRPEWVRAADDGSASFRLALALALQAREFKRGTLAPVDGVRHHWLPLDRQRGSRRFATTGDALHPRVEQRPEVVMHGRRGIDDAVALVERRLVEAAQVGRPGFPLQPAPRAAASLSDLAAWLRGVVDPDRTLALARGLMALDRGLWAEQIVWPSRAGDADWPDDAWLCIRLAHLPQPLPGGRVVGCDPAVVRRLACGDGAGALQLALRRLQAAGIRPAVRAGAVPAATARLWAAALAFPISRTTAGRIAIRLDPTLAQEHLA